ncbi:hypothetical protein K474DRAFT_1708590 [Panus rudis PR-1116 ss-1]|nr:hypothetical protein K474DRAFT_1708590 [Panus rudis PR-1116 ss-1]
MLTRVPTQPVQPRTDDMRMPGGPPVNLTRASLSYFNRSLAHVDVAAAPNSIVEAAPTESVPIEPALEATPTPTPTPPSNPSNAEDPPPADRPVVVPRRRVHRPAPPEDKPNAAPLRPPQSNAYAPHDPSAEPASPLNRSPLGVGREDGVARKKAVPRHRHASPAGMFDLRLSDYARRPYPRVPADWVGPGYPPDPSKANRRAAQASPAGRSPKKAGRRDEPIAGRSPLKAARRPEQASPARPSPKKEKAVPRPEPAARRSPLKATPHPAPVFTAGPSPKNATPRVAPASPVVPSPKNASPNAAASVTVAASTEPVNTDVEDNDQDNSDDPSLDMPAPIFEEKETTVHGLEDLPEDHPLCDRLAKRRSTFARAITEMADRKKKMAKRAAEMPRVRAHFAAEDKAREKEKRILRERKRKGYPEEPMWKYTRLEAKELINVAKFDRFCCVEDPWSSEFYEMVMKFDHCLDGPEGAKLTLTAFKKLCREYEDARNAEVARQAAERDMAEAEETAREKRLAEESRLEQERSAEQARLKQERLAEQARLEQERLAEESRLEQERLAEEARLEQERLEQARLKQERLAEQARLEQERLEQARLEQERLAEQARLEQERLAEQTRLEQEKLEKARLEQERQAEQARLEQEKLEQARLQQARLAEQARLEQEWLAEQARIEQERMTEQARIEQEWLAEQARLRQEWQAEQAARADLERTIRAYFEEYELKWTQLVDPMQTFPPILFGELPWPVLGRTQEPELSMLTLQNVKNFIFYPGRKGENTGPITKSDVRKELLRWHPDKFSVTTVPRIVEAERAAVAEGGMLVAQYLNQILLEM